jgi:iron complex transport system ATP-binding protein
MSTPRILLEARALALQAGGRALCRELSFEVAAGECVVLLGPNGAGKTTLLHTLAGLRAPSAGEVRLDGRVPEAWPSGELARFRGLLSQQQDDHFPASVLETVLVGRHPHLGRWGWEGAEDEAIAREALAALGLADLAARDVLTLSGGERQRVAIAAVLAQSPRLLLLDEPTNHLDLHHQFVALDLLRGLTREGRALVMVLHDINLAARYADRVVLFGGDGGVAAGAAATMLEAARLGRAFAHPVEQVEHGGRRFFVPR